MLRAVTRRRINHGRLSLNPDRIVPLVTRAPHVPPTQVRPVLPHRTIENVPGYRRRRSRALVLGLLWMYKMQPTLAHGQARQAAVILHNHPGRHLVNNLTVSLHAEVFLRYLSMGPSPYLP